MLKHMPKNALAVIQNDLLYSRKKIKLPTGKDRREARTTDANVSQRTDENLTKRIEKFHDQLENTYWYRIPLKYICDIGLVNTPIKFNTKWQLSFETDMQALFKSKENQAADAVPTSVDAKIILESTPYLLYYQFQLEDTFRTYLESAMVSEQVLRTGIKLRPYRKSYEMVAGSQSKTFTFTNVFKQFAFLEFSLLFDRSDQHLNINAEVAATNKIYKITKCM